MIRLGLIAALVAALASDAVAGTLAEEIRERAALGIPASLAIVEVTVPPSLEKAYGSSPRAPIALDWGKRTARAGNVSLRITLGGDDAKSGWARITMAEKAPVLVAVRALAAGDIIKAADLRLENRLNPGGEGWRIAPAAFVGHALQAPIAAGTVVGDTHLTAPPPIARGTEVRVIASRGRVSIVTAGKLETAARLGEPTRVRLLDARRVVDGTLTSDNTVTLDWSTP